MIGSAYELMAAITDRPRAYTHGMRVGAFFMYLLRKHGENKLPQDLVCNKTLKVMHKGVQLYDTLYEYPFDLVEFEKDYAQLT